MASIYKRAGRKAWRISYFDHNGKRRDISSKTTDYAAAVVIGKKLETDSALRENGIGSDRTDRYAAEATRPIAEHLTEFHDALKVKGTAKHAGGVKGKVSRIIDAIGAESIIDLTPAVIQTVIGELHSGEKNRSLQTCHHYLRAIKQFSRWLHRDGRIPENTLAHLTGFNAATDRRYERRALTEGELVRLIDAAEQGKDWRGMSGPDRAMLYRVAVGTGFRASELRSLTLACFDLQSDPPIIEVKAAYSKHRRDDLQPIRDDLAQQIAPWLAERPVGVPVFNMPDRTAMMLKHDLSRARAAWIKQAGNDREREDREESSFLSERDHADRVIDFHALRHTFITRLVASGASVKVAQELARHSDPTLTIGRYSHTRLHDLTAALDNLPSSGPKTDEKLPQRATGTDDLRISPDSGTGRVQQNRQHSPRISARNSAERYANANEIPARGDEQNTLVLQDGSDAMRVSANPSENAPSRTRTCDLRFRRPTRPFTPTS